MTITFGLQPNHIEVIESELERWRGMEKVDGEEFEPKYSKYIWESLGGEIILGTIHVSSLLFRISRREKQK